MVQGSINELFDNKEKHLRRIADSLEKIENRLSVLSMIALKKNIELDTDDFDVLDAIDALGQEMQKEAIRILDDGNHHTTDQ